MADSENAAPGGRRRLAGAAWLWPGIGAIVGAFFALVVWALVPPAFDARLQIHTGDANTDRARQLADALRTPQISPAVQRQSGLNVETRPVYLPLLGPAYASRFILADKLAAPPLGLRRYAWGGELLDLADVQIEPRTAAATLVLIAGADGEYVLRTVSGLEVFASRTGVAQRNRELGVALTVSRLRANDGARFELRAVSGERLAAILASMRIDQASNAPTSLTITLRARSANFARRVADALGRELVAIGARAERARLDTSKTRLIAATDAQRDRRDQARVVVQAARDHEPGPALKPAAYAAIDTTVRDYEARFADELLSARSYEEWRVPTPEARLGAQFEPLLKSLGAAGAGWLRAELKAEVAATRYRQLLREQQLFAQLDAQIVSPVRIVDSARVVGSRLPPAVAMLILGALIGVGGIAFGRRLRRRRHGIVDLATRIEATTGAHVCAVLPPDNEQYSSLRQLALASLATHIAIAHCGDQQASVVALTALSGDEPAGPLALDLAATLAASRRVVVFAGADLAQEARKRDAHVFDQGAAGYDALPGALTTAADKRQFVFLIDPGGAEQADAMTDLASLCDVIVCACPTADKPLDGLPAFPVDQVLLCVSEHSAADTRLQAALRNVSAQRYRVLNLLITRAREDASKYR